MGRTDFRYLLHLWQEHGETKVSLRDLADGGLATFSGIGELSSFLQANFATIDASPAGGSDGAKGGGDRT